MQWASTALCRQGICGTRIVLLRARYEELCRCVSGERAQMSIVSAIRRPQVWMVQKVDGFTVDDSGESHSGPLFKLVDNMRWCYVPGLEELHPRRAGIQLE